MELIIQWGIRLQEKMKNSKLQTALMAYIFLAVLVSVVCYVGTVLFCDSWKGLIIEMNDHQWSTVLDHTMKRIDLFKMLSFFIYLVIALYFASKWYYEKYLKEPLRLLNIEIESINRDDLSFDCTYSVENEMGHVCEGFNAMRLQLIEDKKNMWKLMEAQRELNAAFAHGVRTPLTVMKGYSELMVKYYPTGNVSQEKLMDTLQLIHFQVERLERLSLSMKEVHSFEEMQVNRKAITRSVYVESLEKAIGLRSMQGYDLVTIVSETIPYEMHCDMQIILEVLDNLLANASRYVKARIEVVVDYEDNKLRIYVKDDGIGFDDESIHKALKPYYSTDGEHYGIGLTICKMLCEKHGGRLELSNAVYGGAIICATFYVG